MKQERDCRVRRAEAADVPAVARIYEEILDAQDAGELTVGWERGVYPTRVTAEAALRRGDLFVLEAEEEVVGAAVINRLQVDVYALAPWEHAAAEDGACVLHTLVISPRAAGQGLGRRFVRYYEEYARALGLAELRMDTNARNVRARALYAGLGYREVATVPTVFNGIAGVELVLLEKHLDARDAALV